MKYHKPRSFSSFGAEPEVPKPEAPPPPPPLPGMQHNRDPRCMSNHGAMIYDPECVRCMKINKVIMLKRKTIANGSTEEEAALAIIVADRLIKQYALTRGDIFDRQYNANAISRRVVAQKTYHDTYGAAAARNQPWNKSAGPRGGKKINDYFRKPQFMSEY